MDSTEIIYINATLCVLTFLAMIYSIYSTITKIIQFQLYFMTPLILLTPIGFIFLSYGARTILMSFYQIFGSLKPLNNNSSYYSAINTTPPSPYTPSRLPPIIVHMPVYLESFEDTLKPTIENIIIAIKKYQNKGGNAKIIICDDGLKCLSEEQCNQRIDYYNSNNIGYVGRPKENRAGVFKKRLT